MCVCVCGVCFSSWWRGSSPCLAARGSGSRRGASKSMRGSLWLVMISCEDLCCDYTRVMSYCCSSDVKAKSLSSSQQKGGGGGFAMKMPSDITWYLSLRLVHALNLYACFNALFYCFTVGLRLTSLELTLETTLKTCD